MRPLVDYMLGNNMGRKSWSANYLVICLNLGICLYLALPVGCLFTASHLEARNLFVTKAQSRPATVLPQFPSHLNQFNSRWNVVLKESLNMHTSSKRMVQRRRKKNNNRTRTGKKSSLGNLMPACQLCRKCWTKSASPDFLFGKQVFISHLWHLTIW